MLGVDITQDADNTVSMVEVTDPGLSDGLVKVSCGHLAVIFQSICLQKAVSFRKLRSIDVASFKRDIQSSKALSDSL